MNDYATTKLINAIEYAWTSIQHEHPDTPDVIVTLGSGAHARGLKLGHFAAKTWKRGDSMVCELFVGGEGLERGARAVLGTLLHEAAHGIASTREVKDTSRQGRYHNQHFRALALEVGIDVEKSDVIGWSKTTLPDKSAAKYGAEIKKLEEAIVAYRAGTVPLEGVAAPKRKQIKRIKLECVGCGRTLSIAASEYDRSNLIHCNPCDRDYTEV